MVKPTVGVALAVVVVLLAARACRPDPTPVLTDTRWRDALRDSTLVWEQRDAATRQWAESESDRADSAVRVASAGETRYRRLARWADSVARAGVPNSGRIVPDSGTPNNSASGAPELTVPLVAYDSLYSAYETADSMNHVLHGAVRDYVQAASLYASQAVQATGRYDWAVHTYGERIRVLETALRREARGCRVLGLIPCPTVAVGYGAMLTAGQLRAGPVVSVSIPIRF